MPEACREGEFVHRAAAAARHVLDQGHGRGAVPIQSSSEDVREKPTIPGQNTTQRDRKGGKISRDNSYVYPPFDFSISPEFGGIYFTIPVKWNT